MLCLINSALKSHQVMDAKLHVIRNLDTGRYFAFGRWVHDPKLAENFEDRDRARLVAVQLGLKNADLVTVDEEGRAVSGYPLLISAMTN